MAAPMFGVIVAGRLVQTDFQNIDSTKFLINILDADSINHIVVFLTGAQPFPDGVGGSVYFSWPDPNAAPSWQLLGFITNMKPSAIFKISNIKPANKSAKNEAAVSWCPGWLNTKFERLSTGGFSEPNIQGPFGVQPISHVAQIGISIEPLQQLELQTPIAHSTPSTANSFIEFTTKMLENLFNYIASFAVTPSQIMPGSTESYVPLNTVQQWYLNFQRRLEQNPNFWKS